MISARACTVLLSMLTRDDPPTRVAEQEPRNQKDQRCAEVERRQRFRQDCPHEHDKGQGQDRALRSSDGSSALAFIVRVHSLPGDAPTRVGPTVRRAGRHEAPTEVAWRALAHRPPGVNRRGHPGERCADPPTGHRVIHDGRSQEQVDALQRRHRTIGFTYAVFKRYSEDHGAWLGSLISYYGFFSLYPAVIVFVTVSTWLFRDRPDDTPTDPRSALVEGAVRRGGNNAGRDRAEGLRVQRQSLGARPLVAGHAVGWTRCRSSAAGRSQHDVGRGSLSPTGHGTQDPSCDRHHRTPRTRPDRNDGRRRTQRRGRSAVGRSRRWSLSPTSP